MSIEEYIKIQIKVIPNAKRNAIAGWVDIADGEKALKVCIKAVAEDGKANHELISFLSTTFKIPQREITIAHGSKNRLKVLQINNKFSSLIDSAIDKE